MKGHPLRGHKSYVAAILHRLSGLALVLFLPFHFLLLSTALEGASGLEAALALTHNPWVQVAEWGLVVLLTLHLAFGLRVLVLELGVAPHHSARLARYVVAGLVGALLVGVIFLVRKIGG